MLTEEQRRIRKTGLGGSDIAAICGMNPYKTPYDVWYEKTRTDIVEESTNIHMQIGNALESLVAEHYLTDRNQGAIPDADPGITLHESATVYSPHYPYLFGHPDRLISDGGILEVKIAINYGSQKQWKEGIPPYHRYQVAFYAMLMDAPYVDIAVLCMGESKPRYYRYERDYCFEDDILMNAIVFWNNHVLAEIPPSLTEVIVEKDILNADSIIQSDPDTLEAVIAYAEIKQLQKYMDGEEDRLKKQILSYMGNCDYLTDLNGKTIVSYTSQIRNGFDTTTFKKENADMYAKYIKKSDPIRILKLIADKKEDI